MKANLRERAARKLRVTNEDISYLSSMNEKPAATAIYGGYGLLFLYYFRDHSYSFASNASIYS